MRVALALLLVASAALSACAAASPPVPGPEARCADSCVAKARACSEAQCARGCRIVLDKLVEHEGAHVLACIARADRRVCDEAAFADCAARTGPHLDGGPPPPAPPSDDDDQP